jgi:hypothetical protein
MGIMKSRIGAAFDSAPWLWSLLLLGLAGNLAGWLLIGTLPDEAYYWVWSQRLQAGYYDHPPLIAWMIRPFTDLFGDTGAALRLPSVVGWVVGAGLAWAVGRRLYGNSRAAFLALLIWTSLPIVQIGFHVNTPDTPLVLFTWATFYFLIRALDEGRTGLWVGAGLCAGLALAGKYPGVVAPVAIFAGLGLTRAGRRTLASPGPWVAAAVAALVFAPVVIWNWRHEWISFAFQFHHGVDVTAEVDRGEMFLQFLGGQLGAALPWTWVAMALAALPWRDQRVRLGTARFALLALAFWLPLLLFGYAGLTAKSQPNWPVAAYVPGTLLLAGALEAWLRRGGPWRARAVGAGYLAGLLLVNLLRFPQWVQALPLHLPPQRTQLSQTYGWDEVAPVLREMVKERPGCVVMGNRLQTTSMLALILDDAERVTISSNTRFNQFHLWQQEQPIPVDRLCLYFAQYEEDEAVPERVSLPGQGTWRLARVIEHHNPDLSVRRSAFYLPV